MGNNKSNSNKEVISFKNHVIDKDFSVHKDVNSELIILSNEQNWDQVLIEELGPKYREYRDKWYRAEQREFFPFPLHIDFELMYYCNIDCVMCYMPDKSPGKRMDLNLYKRVIDEGVDNGLCAVELTLYTEPFLCKNLMDFVDYAHKKGIIDILISTNATVFNQEWARKILDSGVTQIFFSIDAATKETYNRIRRGANWDKVMDNIDYFLNLKKKLNRKLPLTRVNFCRQPLNVEEAEQFVLQWQHKVDRIVLQTSYDKEIFKKFDYEIKTERIRKGFTCAQLWQRLVVRYDGKIYPCANFYEGAFEPGDLNKTSIKEYWNEKIHKGLMASHESGKYHTVPACYACAYSYYRG